MRLAASTMLTVGLGSWEELQGLCQVGETLCSMSTVPQPAPCRQDRCIRSAQALSPLWKGCCEAFQTAAAAAQRLRFCQELFTPAKLEVELSPDQQKSPSALPLPYPVFRREARAGLSRNQAGRERAKWAIVPRASLAEYIRTTIEPARCLYQDALLTVKSYRPVCRCILDLPTSHANRRVQ